jgi:tetraacyldisaccharide 4'-kinase
MRIRRTLLWPFATLYALLLGLRHSLYDAGILKSVAPAVPTIAIGNLALGGTGKTPMLELVLRTLEGKGTLATLSRGYGRSGNDIHEVKATDLTKHSGDEAVQVKRKFPNVRVFVGADRVKAIEMIGSSVADLQAVVLDDAFQHRRLKAGMNILLTTWHRPWSRDALIPAGSLRDIPARARNAEMVVVTKCPAPPGRDEELRWRKELRLHDGQQLFFSGIEYLPPTPFHEATGRQFVWPARGMASILLFTGIADPDPLATHLRQHARTFEHIRFPDHHCFTQSDLRRLAAQFSKFAPGPKVLVTTEKDATRLANDMSGTPLAGLPLAVAGMRAVILNDPERFGETIRAYVGTDKTHRRSSDR